jgi:hypothetical protein
MDRSQNYESNEASFILFGALNIYIYVNFQSLNLNLNRNKMKKEFLLISRPLGETKAWPSAHRIVWPSLRGHAACPTEADDLLCAAHEPARPTCGVWPHAALERAQRSARSAVHMQSGNAGMPMAAIQGLIGDKVFAERLAKERHTLRATGDGPAHDEATGRRGGGSHQRRCQVLIRAEACIGRRRVG